MLFAAKKEKTVKTVIRSWQLPSPTLLADTLHSIDTSYLNLPMREILNDYSISNTWNGGLISPVESRIYFRRLHTIDDIFAQQYQPYIVTAKDVKYYNTTVPYSTVAYKRGFTKNHEENEINFFFTGNLNRRLNLGLGLNYLTAYGHYINQESKLFNGHIFGSYTGTHYQMHASVSFNNLSNFENGGIRNVQDLAGPLNPEDIPFRLQGLSGYQYIFGFLNNSYSIGTERERVDTISFINDFGEKDTRDTIVMEYTPMMTFSHTFETNNSRRRYIEKNAYQGYYENTYLNHNGTNDSTNVLTISNTLSATFEEKFNSVLRFGVTAFARNECQRFARRSTPALPYIAESGIATAWIEDTPPIQWMSDTIYSDQWTNNTFLGGSIYKKMGPYIRYDVTGEVCLAGYKLGQFNVQGDVDADFRVGKDTMYISVAAYVRNETPSYYLQHYSSNHFRWENDFTKPFRFYVGGTWSYPTKWFKPCINVGFENITNHIYFDKNGLPNQHNGNIQIISADAQLDLTTPWINLENHVVYQHSSSEYIALPMITLYHNLYYHGCWFKAMDAQIGADVRYFTRYYAPILNPATGQFCAQTEDLIGNYPILNIYANFYVHLIHLKFFAQYTHINHLFMRNNLNYMAMPGYPMNPDVFRAGLAWHFLR